MAAARHPVSELCSPGGAVPSGSVLSGQSLFNVSKNPSEATSPSRRDGDQGVTCPEEPVEVVSVICREHARTPPANETNHSREPGEQKQIPSGHCAPSWASSSLHSLPETHHHPVTQQDVPSLAPEREPCGPSPHRCKSIQDADSQSMLACKQPLQLQQCNIITTVCKGVNSGEGGVQKPPSKCVCSSSSKPGPMVEGHPPPECDKTLCCGSYIHHGNFEDTFAAYCHPQPIPAPSQVLPRHIESNCDMQCAPTLPIAMNHLSLPRLISSVSETGLDAKHLLQCCNLNCSWLGMLPGAGPQPQKYFGLEECCRSPVGHAKTTTQDTGTMTASKQFRDVGVQTVETLTPHVFPKVCLAEETNTESEEGKKQGGGPKSPVKEVKWDAEGMTWEVYGASVDPEELGLAIQRHLELQIRETANQVAKLSRQNTNISQKSSNDGRQRKRSRMMGSIPTPVCCARTSTAVD